MIKGRSSRAAAFFAAAAIIAGMLTMARHATAQAQQAAVQQDAGAGQTLIDKGKATYAEHCSHCHGPGLLNPGTITPDLRRFPDDKTRFFNTVKHGKNGRMPPWGDVLDDNEIAGLWAYISSQRKP